MSKKVKPINPPLRFKNEAIKDWKFEPLSKLCQLVTQKNAGKITTRVLTNSAVQGIVDQRDYFEKDIANADNLDGYCVVELDDFVYNPRVSVTAPVGPISRNNLGTGAMSPLYTIFRFKDSNTEFYEYYFQSSHWHLYLRRASNVGARHDRMAISTTGFKAMPLPVPSEDEGRKIANCLSSIDKLIAAQAKKVDALKTHRKGLMQQLFPADGETAPAKRFNAFIKHQNWKPFTLDEVASFRRGSFPQPYGLPEWYDDLNGHPFVQVFDVDENLCLKPKTKRRITDAAAKQSVFIKKGSLIVTLQGSIGRVAVTHYDAFVDRTLLFFQKFKKPIDIVFFAYVIQNLFEIEKQKAPGGIIKTITKEVLSAFQVHLPDLDEQKEISKCVTSVDNLVKDETNKLKQLQSHKRGLMQQLFPSLEDGSK